MPTLLLDKKRCLRNIQNMSRKAAGFQLSFRPHFKTHQSAEIGDWYRDFGITKITVASFRMASYFALAGWKDILVAFPFNPHDLDRLNKLAGSVRISVLLDNPDSLPFLDQLHHPIEFYVDIDTGYGRTGIPGDQYEKIEHLIRDTQKNSKLHFRGFYCHAGHSYKAESSEEKEKIHLNAVSDLASLKKQFAQFSPLALYGDTPGCSIQEDFSCIDEITPGNFVFYDLMQYTLGSCSLDDIAVAMACPVVGKYPDQKRMVIHGGAVHFSKESVRISGQELFGKGIPPQEFFLTSISQEHGIIENAGAWYDRVQIGDTIHLLPVHSCLTSNLMREYQTLEGNIISTINS